MPGTLPGADELNEPSIAADIKMGGHFKIGYVFEIRMRRAIKAIQEEILDMLQLAYPEATLAMRERRQRRPTPAVRPAPPNTATGRLNAYAES